MAMVGSKAWVCVVAVLFLSGWACGQSKRLLHDMQERERPIAKNGINLEMGGNALVYSLNYDRVLIQTDYYKGTVRIGIGVLPYPQSIKENRTWLFVPIEYNNLFGPKNHFLEVSLGTTYSNSLQGANHWITGRVGYRMHGFDSGFFFRTGMVLQYIPFANPQFYRGALQDIFLPLPSVAWGFAF